MLFLSLETLSIPLYVLAATSRANVRSQEAGMKYFLLGAFASAFFLYGVALLYGATGTTRLADLGQALGRMPSSTGAAAGVGLLTIGLGFKAALVPFHTWAPDVYEGAPLPAATFMAVIAKIGAFLALLRVFPLSLGALAAQWTVVLGALAAVTMILANLAALGADELQAPAGLLEHRARRILVDRRGGGHAGGDLGGAELPGGLRGHDHRRFRRRHCGGA